MKVYSHNKSDSIFNHVQMTRGLLVIESLNDKNTIYHKLQGYNN